MFGFFGLFFWFCGGVVLGWGGLGFSCVCLFSFYSVGSCGLNVLESCSCASEAEIFCEL